MHRRISSAPNIFATLTYKATTKQSKDSIFICNCSVCRIYNGRNPLSPKDSTAFETVARKELTERYSGRDWKVGDYNWLLVQIASTERPLPEVRIPDAILWDKGNPLCVIKTNGGRIVRITKEPMTKDLARQAFCSENRGAAPAQEGVVWKRLSLRAGSLKQLLDDPKGDLSRTSFRAVLKFKAQPGESIYRHPLPVTLLTDKSLGEIFTMWSYERLKTIHAIHAFIKVIGNNPYVVRIHYFSPHVQPQLSPTLFRKCGSDPCDTAAKHIDRCRRICEQIEALLAQYADIELCEMVAEFFTTPKDVWLYDVWRVVYRPIDHDPDGRKARAAREAAEKRELAKGCLIKRLHIHEKGAKKRKDKEEHIETLTFTMDKTVERIRDITGVSNIFVSEFTSAASNAAFAKLRPKCQFSLSTILAPDFTSKKFAQLAHRPEAATVPKRRIMSEVLYGKRLPKPDRLSLDKDQYCTIVKGGLRLMHHALSGGKPTYQDFKDSLLRLGSMISPGSASTAAQSRPTSRSTVSSPDKARRGRQLISATTDREVCADRMAHI